MRLFLRQRVLSVFGQRNYEVHDEKGELCYVIEQQLSFPKEFRAYDGKNKCVGSVKKKLFPFPVTFFLTEDGKTEEVKKVWFGKNYRFLDQNWLAQGSRILRDFRITDKNGTPIATIDNGSRGCAIELSSKEYSIMALLFAVAVLRNKYR